jgi:hypothetical protein
MAAGDDLRRRKAQLEIEEQIAEAIKNSTASLEDFAQAQKKISENYKLIKKISQEIALIEEEIKTASAEEKKLLQAQLDSLKQQQKVLIGVNKELAKSKNFAKAIGNEFLGWGKQLKSTFIPTLNDIFQKFLTIDDLAHQTANTIGFQGSKFKLMNDNLDLTTKQFLAYGYELEDAYKVQTALSDATGRQVMLTQEASKAIAETSRITGMAVDEMASLTGQMELFGLGAQQSADFVLQMSKESADMGLNSGKVIKKFQENLGLLNKLNFKTGIAGLKAMTKFSEKYKLDMNAVASVADKVFRPEGAIEAAAQLQVLGGSLAALGDPFQLMYKARNAPEELAKSLTKAASASAVWDETTKEWKVNAYELDRLKEAASALGMDYTQLVETAKQGAKIGQFEGLLGGKGLDKDTMDALTGAAQMGEGGAFVTVKGDKVFLKDMTKAQAEMFKQQESDNAKLAEQAMSVQNDFTRIKNEIMIAFVDLFKGIDWKMITDSLRSVAHIITGIVGFMGEYLGPTGTLATLLALYFGGKAMMWYMHGKMLGMGFNSVTATSGKGGLLSKLKGSKLNPMNWGKGSATPEIPGTEKVGEVTGSADKVGKTGGAGGSLKSLAGGLTSMGTPQVLFGALNLIPTAVGMVAMVAAIPSLLFLGMVPLKNLSENLFQMALGLEMMGSPKVLAGAAILSVAALGFTLMTAGSVGLAAVAFLGVAAGVGLEGLSVGLSAFGAIAGNPMVWLGVALLAALSGVFVIFSYGVKLIAEGIASVVSSFTNMFTVISSDNIGALLLLGPALIGISFGVFALAASLVALGVAYLAGGFLGLIALGEAAEDVQTAFKGIDPQGISNTVNAINAIDMDKLNALKDLSMWMALLGGTTTIKFDEALHIDGSIELAGSAGGKKDIDWVNDPIFVSKLKQLISEQTEKDKRGGRA